MEKYNEIMEKTIHLKQSTIDYLRQNETSLFRVGDSDNTSGLETGQLYLINQYGFHIKIEVVKNL